MTSTPSDLTRPLDELPDPLAIPTIRAPWDITLRPPGSKSLTNRLLPLAALARGTSTIRRPLLDADDAQRMLAALDQLNVNISRGTDAITIEGGRGTWPSPAPDEETTLNLNNAGTATRFLTAAAILANPESRGIVIDGNDRMRERPIGELLDMLRQLGAHIDELAATACVPVRVRPPTTFSTDPVELNIPTTRSSQFISAIMLVAPFLPFETTLALEGPITSPTYIDMTRRILERIGADITAQENGRRIIIRPSPIEAFEIDVEPDASGATYFWAAAAMTPGARTRIDGLARDAIQGDVAFVNALEQMGATVNHQRNTIAVTGPETLAPIDTDMTDMPDAAMTLAAVCAVATGTSTIRGLRTLRDKETDRLAALRTELRKIGAAVDIIDTGNDEALRITPAPSATHTPVVFDTYDDHRMAMSLALIALHRPHTAIADPACVNKTYPTFFADLAALHTNDN